MWSKVRGRGTYCKQASCTRMSRGGPKPLPRSMDGYREERGIRFKILASNRHRRCSKIEWPLGWKAYMRLEIWGPKILTNMLTVFMEDSLWYINSPNKKSQTSSLTRQSVWKWALSAVFNSVSARTLASLFNSDAWDASNFMMMAAHRILLEMQACNLKLSFE